MLLFSTSCAAVLLPPVYMIGTFGRYNEQQNPESSFEYEDEHYRFSPPNSPPHKPMSHHESIKSLRSRWDRKFAEVTTE